MWVIANGAPKTGSTWPVQLLNATGHFERVPDAVQAPNWQNSSVRTDIPREAVDDLAASPKPYLSKQHWHDEKKEYLGVPGIKVLNSIRDIRDTFVSRYYHDVRLKKFRGSINRYLKNKGEAFVNQFCNYQQYWIAAAGISPQSYYILSYERMSKDYENATKDLLKFCDVDLGDDQFSRVVENCSFAQHDSGPGKFFRKGKVHAFSDDLTERAAGYLLDLATAEGLLDTKERLATFSPALAPYLEMTDVGL